MTTYPVVKLARYCHGLAGVLLAASLSACQTLTPKPPPVMPEAVQRLFAYCGPGDGAMTLQLYQSGVLAGSLETNWLARGADDWQIELTDPLGRSLLHVHGRGGRLEVVGSLASKMPAVSVDPSGLIALGGHSTGIKLREVPCLLGYVYPKSWLPALVDSEWVDSRQRFKFSQAERTMVVETPKPGATGASCGDISWREYWVISRELRWCIDTTKRRSATLTGLKDYQLTWVQIDE